jgi:protein-S-isoprenylcysteine O-methyltransferase Ste14
VEIVTIMANYTKAFPISQRILATLMVNGNADRIRITPFSMFCTLLIVCGTWVRVICYRQLGRKFTFEVSIQKDHRLVTTGPYAIVRHPSYTGVYLVGLGTFFYHSSRGSWFIESGISKTMIGTVVGYVNIVLVITFALSLKNRWEREDRVLKEEFGKQWDEWAKRVPYALVPGII